MSNELTKALNAIMPRVAADAVAYYDLTGKPLGITGEYGEWLAASKTDWELVPARAAGYDAIDKKGRKIQIKTRAIDFAKKHWRSNMMGGLKLDQEFDAAALVLLDQRFELKGIWLADREVFEKALARRWQQGTFSESHKSPVRCRMPKMRKRDRLRFEKSFIRRIR